jgi:hypothetical protein
MKDPNSLDLINVSSKATIQEIMILALRPVLQLNVSEPDSDIYMSRRKQRVPF